MSYADRHPAAHIFKESSLVQLFVSKLCLFSARIALYMKRVAGSFSMQSNDIEGLI